MTINDTRTEAEIRYDAERDGSRYFQQPRENTDLLIQILERLEAHERADDEPPEEPFDTMPDGTVIYGIYDGTPDAGYERSSCVTASGDNWLLTVAEGEAAGHMFDQAIDFQETTPDQLRALRDLLNSGILERMEAAAVAWGRGDKAPLASRTTEQIQITREIDRILDEKQGNVERQIGTIAGQPVSARYSEGRLYAASVEWGGTTITTDGETYISIPENDGAQSVGDVTLRAWGLMRELAGTDVVEQLIGLARKHARA